MADLDEVSTAIGGLQANVTQLLRLAEKHETQMDATNSAVTQMSTNLDALVITVTTMKPHVDHYARMRRGVAVAVVGLSSVAASVGAAAQHLIEKKLFNGG